MPPAPTNAAPTDGSFRLGEVVEEARDLIKGTKGVFLGMGLIALAVFAAAGVLTRPFVGEAPMTLFSPLGLLGLVLAAPIQAAFAAAGLHRAARRDVSIHLMVRYLDRTPRFVLLALAGGLVDGMLVFTFGNTVSILGAFVTVLLNLAVVFVIDRDAGVLAAVAGAWRILTSNVRGFVLYTLLAIVLLLVSALTLGIAFIWTLPFLSIATALIYAHAVGIESL